MEEWKEEHKCPCERREWPKFGPRANLSLSFSPSYESLAFFFLGCSKFFKVGVGGLNEASLRIRRGDLQADLISNRRLCCYTIFLDGRIFGQRLRMLSGHNKGSSEKEEEEEDFPNFFSTQKVLPFISHNPPVSQKDFKEELPRRQRSAHDMKKGKKRI